LHTENAFEKGFICRDKLEGQVISERIFIKDLIKLRMLHKRLDLGSKHQRSVHLRIIERLDPENISRPKQLLVPFLTDHNRIRTPRRAEESFARLLISVDQRLRIRARDKGMSCLHELRPEFLVIVYLSVEDKDHTPILVVKRLITHRRKIYEAQPSEAQSRI